MRQRIPLLACLILAAPTGARAQRLEVAVNAGYFLPTAVQFQRDVVILSSTGFSVAHYDAHHEPGFAVSVSFAAWPVTHAGFDLAAGFRFSTRSGSSPYCICPYLPVPSGDYAIVSSLALRAVARATAGSATLRLGAGPALVHLGGSAYDGGTPEITLAKQTFGGGSFLIDATRPVGSLRLRLGVEDLIYRVRMSELPPGGNTTETPLQHDIAVTASLALPLR